MKRKSPELTIPEVLECLRRNLYSVDLERGIIYRRNGKPLHTEPDKNRGALHVRIWFGGRRRMCPVAALVWMVGANDVVPPNYEVHHRDENILNNSWENLVCLHKSDHHKIHELISSTETPF